MEVRQKYDVFSRAREGFSGIISSRLESFQNRIKKEGKDTVAKVLNEEFPLQEYTHQSAVIPFRESNPKNGKYPNLTMVMIPGVREPTSYYFPYLEAFGENVHVIVPAFTHSATNQEYLEGIHDLITEKRQQGPVVIAGRSLGGVYEMHYEEQYQGEVQGRIFSHTATQDSPVFRSLRFWGLQVAQSFLPLLTYNWPTVKANIAKKASREFAARDPLTAEDPLHQFYQYLYQSYEKGEDAEPFTSKEATRYLTASLEATQASRSPWLRRQKRLQKKVLPESPTLIIQTERDPVMPPQKSKLIQKYPYAQVHTLYSSYGHHSPYAFGQDSMCLVADFLQKYFALVS